MLHPVSITEGISLWNRVKTLNLTDFSAFSHCVSFVASVMNLV